MEAQGIGSEEAVEQTIKHYPSHIMDLLFGIKRTQILFTANELGIFDLCVEGGAAVNVAKIRGLDPEKTERLLDALVSLELLVKKQGTTGAIYYNTDIGQTHLTSGHATSMNGFIRYNQLMSFPTNSLMDSLRPGAVGGIQVLLDQAKERGMSQGEFEDIWAQGNAWSATAAGDALAAAFDLSHFKSACDLGGGSGSLALKLVKRYPQLNIKILEHPDRIELLNRNKPSWAGKEAERVTFTSNNFRTEDLPDADLFIMGHVNNASTDTDTLHLWKKIFNALPSGGGILVCERLLDEDRTGPPMVSLTDIYMAANSQSGRERTASEFKHLLQTVGFAQIDVKKFPKYMGYDPIFAIKP